MARRRGRTPILLEGMHSLLTSLRDSRSSTEVSTHSSQQPDRTEGEETDLFSIIELFSHMTNDSNLLVWIPVTE